MGLVNQIKKSLAEVGGQQPEKKDEPMQIDSSAKAHEELKQPEKVVYKPVL